MRKRGFNRVPKQSLSVHLFGVTILEQPTCLPILFSIYEQNIFKLIFVKDRSQKKKKKNLQYLSCLHEINWQIFLQNDWLLLVFICYEAAFMCRRYPWLRGHIEGFEPPKNNIADNDKVDVVDNTEPSQQTSASQFSTDNATDMETKNQVVNYISSNRKEATLPGGTLKICSFSNLTKHVSYAI